MRVSDWWVPGVVRQLAAALEGLRLQLAAVLTNINLLSRSLKTMSDALQDKIDELSADVAAGHEADLKAQAKFLDLAQKLAEALAHAQSTGATPEQLAKLEELHQSLSADTAALTAATTPPDAGAVDNTGTVTTP